MTLYDSQNKRLALFHEKATPEFWDHHWRGENLKKEISSGKTHYFIRRFTRRFIPPGGRILEGGCGIGHVVYGLQEWGYEAYGVDFAKETIGAVKKFFPNLQLSVQDVKNMNFPDNYFDGYWSLGVIEHFWNGYDDIVKEAQRVIKPGGYLFLTFPVMSPLRRLKARLGYYKTVDHTIEPDNFYEFALDTNYVVRGLAAQGFVKICTYPYDALKGLKDEVAIFKPFLQKLYEARGVFVRSIRFGMTLLLGNLTGHMILLVLKKKE